MGTFRGLILGGCSFSVVPVRELLKEESLQANYVYLELSHLLEEE